VEAKQASFTVGTLRVVIWNLILYMSWDTICAKERFNEKSIFDSL